ncbi:MAG: hypothetical protein OXF93_20030 [Acidobacteria bacterium]|nr:hypothetical protein [Acidobacteriota bacterium]
MTNGKTTLTFDHSVHDAVRASLDALTLADAWASDDRQTRAELVKIKSELEAVLAQLNTARTVPYKI